jgi:Tol biopolymer transport system component/DNA-binding winged helix-turn-helix (wHTH) protein
MHETQSRPRLVRFGAFEANLRTGELRKDGVKLKFSGQPFQVLAILLERQGDVVTREELQKRIWPDTFVDVERNLNTAVNKIREVLGDSADVPRFVETLPRRGYRFIAPVEPFEDAAEEKENSKAIPLSARGKPAVPLTLASTAIILLAVAGWIAYRAFRSKPPASAVQRSLTRLTFDEGLQTGATWSPDGRFIAYSSDRGGKFDIWVQQVSGGNPVQITRSPGQNWQPDWSPDGKYIAYRSEEGDGGIYAIPAIGGAGLERKIASFGYFPRWSPNSLQVMFQTQFTELGVNHLYVAQLDSSPPREVLADFLAQNNLPASSAAWHPDGTRITVWVADASPVPIFWTVPIAGGPGIKLEIPPSAQRELTLASGEGEAGEQLGDYSFSWSPLGNAVYFERGYKGARNIWRLAVDPGTLRATGIDRLTTGPGADAGVAVSRDGMRMAFTAKSQRIQTWLFPFDASSGHITGNGEAITSPGRTSIEPDLSRDGTKVAYIVPHGEKSGLSNLDVRNEVWVKSLLDGGDTPVIADNGYSRWFGRWSPDGIQLAYSRRNLRTNETQLMVWSSLGHDEKPLAAPNTVGGPYDWSSDGKWLLDSIAGTIRLAPLAAAPHVETGAKEIVFDHPGYTLFQPRLSPDDRWIVFEAVAASPSLESALYVVPVAGGPSTRITDGRHWDDKPRWSPDGKTIYFVSGPGGFFNIWGIHFDPATGKTFGQPFQVSKFERPHRMIPRWIPSVGISLTQDKLVSTIAEESGNIWVLDNVDR